MDKKACNNIITVLCDIENIIINYHSDNDDSEILDFAYFNIIELKQYFEELKKEKQDAKQFYS